MIEPTTARELADALREASDNKQRLQVGGRFSKRLIAGPNDLEAARVITTAKLDRLLAYEPRDLTISVGSGMPYTRLQEILAANHQMVPLDPPFAADSTIGGVVASNLSGPRRRQYGTARDLVIGMEFARMDGRLVQSGGMVVKNVAGLDMGKLMIGSFGTLAIMTALNFKLVPTPPSERTFAIEFDNPGVALALRDTLLRGPVQPGAVDLLNPMLAAEHGFHNWTLAMWFGGNEALMARCERELEASPVPGALWNDIREITPRFLERFPDGAVVRISARLDQIGNVLEELPVPAIARAGTGVIYAYFARGDAAAKWLRQANARGWKGVIEFASEHARAAYDLWPEPGSDFAIMRKIKHMFDPDLLLNRGRLYRHL